MVCSSAVHSQVEWTWQNPLPMGNDLVDVWVFDQNRMIAAGSKGAVVRTSDGGNTFDLQYVNIENLNTDFWKCRDELNQLIRIHFVNDHTGWIISERDLYKTVNGGSTWFLQLSPDETIRLKDVYFRDDGFGILITSTDSLLISYDSGASWDARAIYDYSSFSSLFFITHNTGWMIANGNVILKTGDGGETWTEQGSIYEGCLDITSFCFVDSLTGWLLGYSSSERTPVFFATADGGENWYPHNISELHHALGLYNQFYKVYFINKNKGWLLHRYGAFQTTDGGATWDSVSVLQSGIYEYGGIEFCDHQHGWIVRRNGQMYKTTDGGAHWISQTNAITSESLGSVYFSSPEIGWIVGDNGVFLKTNDGGNHWIKQPVATTKDLYDVYFFDEQTAWVVGDSGIILSTRNAGMSWEFRQSQTSSDLKKTFFISQDTGWVCGTNELLYTTDGGQNWLSLMTPGTYSLVNIHFFNKDEGVAIDGSFIYKSYDGGMTWVIKDFADWGGAGEMYFSDENHGWISGYITPSGGPTTGLLWITDDGGETWDHKRFETVSSAGKEYTDYLTQSIYFLDSLHGWAAGFYSFSNCSEKVGGLLLFTEDGGLTWNEMDIGTAHRFNSVFFVDSQTGWVVGEDGVILKLTRSMVDVTHRSTDPLIPTDLHLYQNYPNPFNASTTIRYQLSMSDDVLLEIYSSTGQKVTTLVSKMQSAGSYGVKWDAGDAASGIYLCRLSLGNGIVQTRKIVLIK